MGGDGPGNGESLVLGSRFGVIVLLFTLATFGFLPQAASAACGESGSGEVLLAVAPPAAIAPPAADVSLCLEARQDRRVVTYTIHFDNVGGTAVTVDLRDRFPVGTEWLGNLSSVNADLWSRTYVDLRPGPHSVDLSVGLNETVRDGDRIVNLVTMEYR